MQRKQFNINPENAVMIYDYFHNALLLNRLFSSHIASEVKENLTQEFAECSRNIDEQSIAILQRWVAKLPDGAWAKCTANLRQKNYFAKHKKMNIAISAGTHKTLKEFTQRMQATSMDEAIQQLLQETTAAVA